MPAMLRLGELILGRCILKAVSVGALRATLVRLVLKTGRSARTTTCVIFHPNPHPTLWPCLCTFVLPQSQGYPPVDAKCLLYTSRTATDSFPAPAIFYYEAIECGRRMLLTGVLVFIAPNNSTQTAMACIFAFVSLLGFELMRPHVDPTDVWLYRLVSLESIAVHRLVSSTPSILLTF